MLKPPTQEALIALEQVSKLPRWKDINNMIEAELTATLDKIMGCTDTAVLHELRGRAKAFKEFQTEVAQAADKLAKMGLRSPLV